VSFSILTLLSVWVWWMLQTVKSRKWPEKTYLLDARGQFNKIDFVIISTKLLLLNIALFVFTGVWCFIIVNVKGSNTKAPMEIAILPSFLPSLTHSLSHTRTYTQAHTHTHTRHFLNLYHVNTTHFLILSLYHTLDST